MCQDIIILKGSALGGKKYKYKRLGIKEIWETELYIQDYPWKIIIPLTLPLGGGGGG